VPAALAGVLLIAGPLWARGGGGHGGGFHGGAFHSGGFHSGGFHNGGFHSGGFRSGGFHHGGFRGGSFHHRGFFPGYYGYYPSYSYYPSYGSYSPYGYFPSYDLGYGSDPGPGYYDSSSGAVPSYSSGYQALAPYATVTTDTAPTQTDAVAHVTVRVPANAQLWFDGSITTSTGSVREFQSPSLNPGRYTYAIRARWTENGRVITQTQKIAVSPGAHVSVDFPVRSGTN
jgi:uncharacterized protein (TIGR03000 family)